MDNSEEQFQELIANLAPRINKALSQQNTVPLMGLLLSEEGDVEVLLWLPDDGSSLSDELNKFQGTLIEKAKELSSVAACMSYPDYASEAIVALLENNKNYCTKCTIPVVSDATPQLDLGQMEVEDGFVFIFGEGGP